MATVTVMLSALKNLRNGETRGDFGVGPNGIWRPQWLCISELGTKCHCNSG